MTPRARQNIQLVVNFTYPASLVTALLTSVHLFAAPTPQPIATFSAVQEQRLQAVETLAVFNDKEVRDLKIVLLERFAKLQESLARVETKLEQHRP